jgi:hypothetical protein
MYSVYMSSPCATYFYAEFPAPHPTQAGVLPLVGCSQLLIQSIRSYYPYDKIKEDEKSMAFSMHG